MTCENGQANLSAPRMPEMHRVGVRIPAFIPSEPELWFSMVEHSFEASGITLESTKYSYVSSALEPRYAIEVKDLIICPPAQQPYSTLKAELLRRLSVSQETKTRRLLEHEELGDRKPSQFLRHLRDLGGSGVTDSVLKTLWLTRLPATAQAILATQRDEPLDKVADFADVIIETTGSTVPQVAATQVSTPLEMLGQQFSQLAIELRQEVAAMRAEICSERRVQLATPQQHSRFRSRSRSRFRSGETSQQGGRFCWYHYRFGADARKCIPPCSFQENAAGTR